MVPLQVGLTRDAQMRELTEDSMVPYSLIDLVYGIPALERGDGFTNAQGELSQLVLMARS